ncbi:CDP-diacylglycerol diphosphatase [Salinisphaera sp. LB1]|uniref:CDP-diacylglycerol diphosphatase n=1 Tax=Salinisphaera sp. LB1 TaxID=2183911 RepID=UPI001314029F|nr:CDP-diacylglycerol diphosphatase [Salinisphaera sp. LB1]
MRPSRPRVALVLLAAIGLLGMIAAGTACAHDPNALWHIVHDKCVPAARADHGTGPCARVDTAGGYALLKDLVGPLQYLLIPTRRVTGIESPAVLAPGTPHYFAEAWRNRGVMAQRFGHRVPDDDILLALNSPHGRTQNQLHIHISCIDPMVKQRLTAMAHRIGRQWAALPRPLQGHRYIARRVSINRLERESAVRLLADHDHARQHMGDYGMALTAVNGAGPVLLATRTHRLAGNFGSAEELSSHACGVLPGIDRFRAP